jgi:hypothetical protein
MYAFQLPAGNFQAESFRPKVFSIMHCSATDVGTISQLPYRHPDVKSLAAERLNPVLSQSAQEFRRNGHSGTFGYISRHTGTFRYNSTEIGTNGGEDREAVVSDRGREWPFTIRPYFAGNSALRLRWILPKFFDFIFEIENRKSPGRSRRINFCFYLAFTISVYFAGN